MEIDHCDPLQQPDPTSLLALAEDRRTYLVEQYHEGAGVELRDAIVHALLHVAVENQVAEGDAIPVGKRLRQLMAQGVERHRAIHAVGTVLISHLANKIHPRARGGDSNQSYLAALKRLDARKLRRSS